MLPYLFTWTARLHVSSRHLTREWERMLSIRTLVSQLILFTALWFVTDNVYVPVTIIRNLHHLEWWVTHTHIITITIIIIWCDEYQTRQFNETCCVDGDAMGMASAQQQLCVKLWWFVLEGRWRTLSLQMSSLIPRASPNQLLRQNNLAPQKQFSLERVTHTCRHTTLVRHMVAQLKHSMHHLFSDTMRT